MQDVTTYEATAAGKTFTRNSKSATYTCAIVYEDRGGNVKLYGFRTDRSKAVSEAGVENRYADVHNCDGRNFAVVSAWKVS